jgi:hypothetical protein
MIEYHLPMVVQVGGVTHQVRLVAGVAALFFHTTFVRPLSNWEVSLMQAAFNAGVDKGYAKKSAIEAGNLE